MANTTFLYSKFAAFFNFIIVLGGLCFLIYIPTVSPTPVPFGVLLAWGILLLVPIFGLFFIFRKYLLPALQGYVALELDNEKLTFYLNDRVIYWRDVEDVSITYWHSAYLSFKMKHGEDKVTVGLKWITGSTNYIFEQVQNYLDEHSR